MRISYITEYDALDIKNWSGLGLNIAKALENQQAEIHYISNLKPTLSLIDVAKKVYYKALGKTYSNARSVSRAAQFASQVNQRLDKSTDIVFSPGTLPLALMKNHFLKVFYTDATFAGMLNFYPDFFNLSQESINTGHYLEQKALDNCALAIYASEWAANSALENYKVDSKKVKVVPFGANLDAYRTIADINTIIRERSKEICKLLFLGVDWERKGGDMALKIATCLNDRGIKTELHVAGIKNLTVFNFPDFVKNHGFLSKSSLIDKIKIETLLSESHFLILPSVAEAFGLVFCEASAFGLPSLATNVGGITSAIKPGVNGATFPVNSDVMDYVSFIENHFQDFSRYEALAHSSFDEFQLRLNWDVSGRRLIELLNNVMLISS